ncbi:hypothetical protein FRB99_003501 [Tulasnella sp. 403]|nr:hypothetical protein FRB99_003501 [Tulasnella sp. 403]
MAAVDTLPSEHVVEDEPTAPALSADHEGQNGSADHAADEHDVEHVDSEENVGPVDPATVEEKPKAAVSEEATMKKTIDTSAKPGVKPGPKTPLVKKILNSGKFGVQAAAPTTKSTSTTATGRPSVIGVAKKAPSNVTINPTVAKRTLNGDASAPTSSEDKPEEVKTPSTATSSEHPRPTTTTSAITTKPASKPGPAPSSAIAKPAPRPSAASHASRPSVASSVMSKSSAATARKSVASPTPSTASATTKAAATTKSSSSTSKPSSSTTTTSAIKKPASRASLPATTSRTLSGIKPAPSRSPLLGVKEEFKTDPELEAKYKDALAQVEAKTEAIASLESQLETLKSGLAEKVAEIATQTSELEALQISVTAASTARQTLEAEVARLKDSSDSLVSEHELKFKTTHDELEVARAELAASVEEAKALKESQVTLQSTISQLQEDLKAVTQSQSDGAASAAVEHAALLKAQDDLAAIKVESDALAASHTAAVSQYEQTIASLKSHVTVVEQSVESLRAEIESIKQARDDSIQKVTELEVKILEMTDDQETAEEGKIKELAELKASYIAEKEEVKKTLEAELAKAAEAHQEAVKKWEEATAAAQEKHSETLAQALKEAEENAAAANLQAQEALAKLHAEALWEKEAEALHRVDDVKKRVKELEAELESQEGQYNAKLEAVKAEHETLLQKAFADAKGEAGLEHSKELATLRERSEAAAEQLKAAHQSQVESINASHQEALDSQVKSLEKQAASLNLELGATQDSLAKAKATLSAATTEVETLKAQLEAAAKEVEIAKAAAAADKDAALEDLARQLSNTQREMNDLSEGFKATQVAYTEELTQAKQHHQQELEEASKGRVEALEALQKAHDEALAALKVELAEVKSQLEDEREGKQQAVAEVVALRNRTPPATPKAQANGVITKDELAKLHEAHDAKLSEVESTYQDTLKAVQAELFALKTELQDTKNDLDREKLEKGMYEEEAREGESEINALKAELEQLKEQLAAK